MNNQGAINRESLDGYNELFQRKLEELERQKQEQWEEYQKALQNLQNEHNHKLAQIEEHERTLDRFRNIDVENISIELIEELENNLEKTNLSEDEMIIVMSRLVDLSANDLIQENIINTEELVVPVIEKPTVQKSSKEIESEIIRDYAYISKEVDRVYKLLYNFEDNYYDAIDVSVNDNIGKTKEQKQVLDIYMAKAGMCKRKLNAIDADYTYLKSVIDGATTKNIIKSKDEICSRIERIKETINEINELLPDYETAYERFEEAFKHQEEVLKETVEELEDQGEDLEKGIQVAEEVQEEKEENEIKEIETDDETETEESELENEEHNTFEMINPEIVEEYETTYGEALRLIANYNKAIKSNIMPQNSYLHSYFIALQEVMKNEIYNNTTEEELLSKIRDLRITIDSIEASADGELKNMLFPAADAQHINIGNKNIVIFLADNGKYLIEDDLNSMVSGDKTKAASELKKAIETKYTVRSWNNDLRLNSDNLKGSKVKVGSKTYEARNCKCGTGSTRISVWPVSLNPETKEKIKNKYALDDNFENVLLVCGIALNHRINEHLKGQVNSHSKRITEIDEMFSDPNTDLKDIEALIDDSSKVCGRVFESGMGTRQ